MQATVLLQAYKQLETKLQHVNLICSLSQHFCQQLFSHSNRIKLNFETRTELKCCRLSQCMLYRLITRVLFVREIVYFDQLLVSRLFHVKLYISCKDYISCKTLHFRLQFFFSVTTVDVQYCECMHSKIKESMPSKLTHLVEKLQLRPQICDYQQPTAWIFCVRIYHHYVFVY